MIKIKQILASALLLGMITGICTAPVYAGRAEISLVKDVSVFATDFNSETQVYLYSTFNVNRGDKGSVVYAFASSPNNNDGSAKDGQSVLSVLNEGKTSYPRTEVILDTNYDYSTGYYKLSYSFFLAENHMTNHLLMLRQSQNDIPLLSVNESGKYAASSSELDKVCELNKWHTAEIIISMADTENPQTFDAYADGELLAENVALGRPGFDKLTAYHFNANAQAASVYLDDISFDKLKISDSTEEEEPEPDEEIKTDIEIPGELPDTGDYVVRSSLFATDFDNEPDDFLSTGFNVYGGDKGSVVYAFSDSPPYNDGSEKSGKSIRSELGAGKAYYPRANAYFDRGYDTGTYLLSYSFYLSGNHINNNLVMLRQGTADVPLLSVGEDGSFQTAERRLGYECILGKWYDVDVLIYLSGTDSPNTFDIYINGNEAAVGCKLSRTSFNRITAYHHNDNLLDAVSYLDDISLKELVINPGAPTVSAVTCGGSEDLGAVPVENTKINIEFSHEIDPESSEPMITVTDSDSNAYRCTAVFLNDRKTLSLSFTDVLLMARNYTLTVAGVTDIYGNIMEKEFNRSFATQTEGFALSSIVLTDESGNPAESIPVKELCAVFTVQNMTQNEESACLIAALIKPNGKIRAYGIDDVKAAAGEIRKVNINLDTSRAQEGDIIRIFIWDGFDTMNSLGEYIEIN